MILLENVFVNLSRRAILKDVSAQFDDGHIHGIIGNNGSGKSVMFKTICGFIRPARGRVTLGGVDYAAMHKFPPHMGLLIESPGMLPECSGYENLMRLASIRGLITRKEVCNAISTVGLDPGDRRTVSKYSLGMKQRLGIAQAIMENPDILLLDEPMNGLDNAGVREMRELFKSLRAQ
ncbi:MAG: ATP-binding cassette domain-containing protein, partial [Candidatus Fimadaptatus sp.]|nr:ATP-binding cassette domain-containing protein [Candidatus Fimadaptatus sp.]